MSGAKVEFTQEALWEINEAFDGTLEKAAGRPRHLSGKSTGQSL